MPFKISIIIFFLSFGLIQFAFGFQQSALFSVVETLKQKHYEDINPTELTLDISYSVLDAIIIGTTTEFSVPVNDNYFIEFSIESSRINVLGTQTIVARNVSDPTGSIAISMHDNVLKARIYDLNHGNLEIIKKNGGYHLRKIDEHDELSECPEIMIPDVSLLAQNISAPPVTHTDLPAIVDVMIVYTPNANSWANDNAGGIQHVIAQSMENANITAQNSGLDLEFRLVHAREIDYSESGSSYTDICRITTNDSFEPCTDDRFSDFPGWPDFTGYMDEVHDLRELYGADLVALFTQINDVGGLGWLMRELDSDFSSFGFSITRVQQASGSTHVHEMGHNMGSMHSRLQNSAAADETGGLFPYSTGWRWNGESGQQFVSVMTYAQGAQRVLTFSNPDVLWDGVPTGSYEGEGAPADNARSLRESKHTVASFMPRTVGDPIFADLREGWNMISTPYDLTNTASPSIIPNYNEGTLFAFDNNYQVAEELIYGSGYWINVSDAATPAFMGVKRDDITISLNEGWNLIGAPRIPISVNQIIDEDNILETDLIFTYENGYITTQTFEPGRAYWVFAYNTGSISFDFDSEIPAYTMLNTSPQFVDIEERVLVRSGSFSAELIWDVKNITQPKNVSSLPPLPPAGVPEARFSNNSNLSHGNVVSILLNPTDEEYEFDFSTFNQPVMVSYNYQGKTNEFHLSSFENILNIPGEAEKVEISLIDEAQHEKPKSFKLMQNYPNPFNATTNIVFSLPKYQNVSLDIFSITGEKVRTLINQEMTSGTHTVSFDAFDLSTGMYFYRLRAGEFVKTRKMLLLK